MENSWSLIAQGRFLDAVKRATEEYEDGGSKISLGHRAMALLLLKDYKGALEDYLTILNMVEEFYVNN